MKFILMSETMHQRYNFFEIKGKNFYQHKSGFSHKNSRGE